ncbi:MAG: hypothetical protein Fur0044_09190 [Anaerolineae bacterium]|nr:type I restriction-modification system subunit M N-terminal domain-containing protein [Anaerolineales bacterium]MCQ3975473.1 hypothetical protein [Anaerolineae bacterium]
MSEASAIVQRVWNYCNVLRDDGVSYGDYLEQLTYLLFLKMADELEQVPLPITQRQLVFFSHGSFSEDSENRSSIWTSWPVLMD